MMMGFRNGLVAMIAAGAAIYGCAERDATGAGERSDQSAAPSSDGKADAGAQLAQLARSHGERVLGRAPEFATILGVSEDVGGKDYNARLGAYGFEANQEARRTNEDFLQEIRAMDKSALEGGDVIAYDVLRSAYETGARRNQFEFGAGVAFGSSSPYFITQLSGPHLFLPRLLQTQQPMNNAADAESYLARLGQIERVFTELSESISADAALGVVPPYFALEGAARSIEQFIALEPAENPLVTTLEAKFSQIDEIDAQTGAQLTAQAQIIVETSVYPAYERLAQTLTGLVDQAGVDAGVWRLGETGSAFYQHALNAYGANGRTGDDIHALGLGEVDRITKEMDARLRAAGLTQGSVAERFAQIGARAQMRYENTDAGRAALLSELNSQVNEIMAAAPEWFGAMPDQAVVVRRIPEYEQDSSAGGYYTSPSLDGERPGIYWINLKDTRDWPKHTLKTLTYHEAVPGHHFQRSLERAAGLPLIRNMFGYSEFAEGWALYAEQVAAEMGMYEDDIFGDLGRLQSELFRAARLVVDTGLHHKRWTREEAIDYMANVTGDTRASITREVERYSVWPGQATAYKLGMLKINELRQRAQDSLGDEFDIRAFHDEILLTGAMPLPVLEKKIDAWIAKTRARQE